MKKSTVRTSVLSVAVVILFADASPARAADAGTKTLIDYFLPTPIVCPLTSNTWGAAGVLPRDVCNGLEDSTGTQWTYWDGKIMEETSDGSYHLFASRWPESAGFGDWPNAVAVHAVSNATLMGSYIPDANPPFTMDGGKGQNVTGSPLNNGSYVILDSPGNIFLSTSLYGPWAFQATIQITANGYPTGDTTENQSLWQNVDGSFLMATRPFEMMVSPTLTGPYVIQGPDVLPTIAGLTGQPEDPVIWCSGGQYHMVANWWSIRKAWHLTSVDGIHNWTSMGLAYDPTTDFIRYTDGTVNHWYNIERPGVFLKNGHVTAFSFAVSDIEKNSIVAGDGHLTKVIVVPFDGVNFDLENPGPGSADCPADSVGPVDAGNADASRDAGGMVDGAAREAGNADASRPTDAGGTVDGAALEASGIVDGAAQRDGGRVVDAGMPVEAGGGADVGGQGGLDANGAGTNAGSSAGGCTCQTAGGNHGANGAAGGIGLLAGLMLAAGRRRRRDVAARLVATTFAP